MVQNETHPYNQWRELKKFFDHHGTVLESWYPLGGRDRFGRSGFAMLAADPVIVDLAKKHGKSAENSKSFQEYPLLFPPKGGIIQLS